MFTRRSRHFHWLESSLMNNLPHNSTTSDEHLSLFSIFFTAGSKISSAKLKMESRTDDCVSFRAICVLDNFFCDFYNSVRWFFNFSWILHVIFNKIDVEIAQFRDQLLYFSKINCGTYSKHNRFSINRFNPKWVKTAFKLDLTKTKVRYDFISNRNFRNFTIFKVVISGTALYSTGTSMYLEKYWSCNEFIY